MLISFESFPPNNSLSIIKLYKTYKKIFKLQPLYFSITFKFYNKIKFNNTLKNSINFIKEGFKSVPHISCFGYTKKKLNFLIKNYKIIGIKNLIILRGDKINTKIFRYIKNIDYANKFIKFIKLINNNYFNFKVAVYPEIHPESKSYFLNLKNFIKKIKAGATSAITQYFYNTDSYYDLIRQIKKNILIIPGIMPIINFNQLIKFSKFCETEIPRWMLFKLINYKNNKNFLKKFSLNIIIKLCINLLNHGIFRLHFYLLNKSNFIKELYKKIYFK